MADFSLKEITNLDIGDLVISIDSFGNIVKTEVITILHFDKRLRKIYYYVSESFNYSFFIYRKFCFNYNRKWALHESNIRSFDL